MSENSRHLRLAMRALKTYRTHLRNAHARMCAPESVRHEIDDRAKLAQYDLDACARFATEADAHLAAKVRSRK